MSDTIHLSAWILLAIAAIIAALLTVIARFLRWIVEQFDLATKPIKTEITKVGQPYVDDPIYDTLEPKPERVSKVAQALSEIYKFELPREIRVLIGYQMVRLNWIRPPQAEQPR